MLLCNLAHLTNTGRISENMITSETAVLCTLFHVSDVNLFNFRFPGPIHRDLRFSKLRFKFRNLF